MRSNATENASCKPFSVRSIAVYRFLARFFSRPVPQSFPAAAQAPAPGQQTFILEPILTPSALVDSLEDTPDPETWVPDPLDPILDRVDASGLEALETAIAPLAFIENSDGLDATFESGVFTVGESGEVSIDFLFDGGAYRGELAIFSLEGMDEFDLDSPDSRRAFIQEAANRALSDSELGHVAISDRSEGARFSGELGERNWNRGGYLGSKPFAMTAGDRYF